MHANEYARCDATELAELIRSRQVSSLEVVEVAIDIAERRNPDINAICPEAFDHARRQAADADRREAEDRPFAGVPFLLKEMGGELKNWPHRRGSRAQAGNVSTFTSELIARYLATGVIPMGTTTLPEFASIAVTESSLYGDTRNPWNLAHTPGGSSGGAAAAVAAGIVPIAHANDGAGSIRIPASCCGLVGMKPSRGRMPQAPAADLGMGLGMEHVITRTVRDTAAMLEYTMGEADGPPYVAPDAKGSFLAAVDRPPERLRIAYWTRYWDSNEPTHPECVTAVEQTARLLGELGHELDEQRPEFDYISLQRAFFKLWAAFSAAQVDELAVDPTTDAFEPYTLELATMGRKISATDLIAARDQVFALGRVFGAFHNHYDLMLTTVLGTPPIQIGAWRRDTMFPDDGVQAQFMLCSGLANATGQPAISLPLHVSADDLPVGIMLTAAFGREDLLLQIAGQLEKARPWQGQTPAHWA